ncbi:hypothetical protein LWI28_026393 [Acer negundo]|uniref:Serine-threonine/tyrosine-protein kinase catalytic domain-containing protein n=1 Tax=Acer negundo TaxID=4023 RepID=A0AAD5J6T8_ACENE|nr:hypothetical protein LWI28_026393 [Acer negundo]
MINKLVPFKMELVLFQNRVNCTTDRNGFQFVRLEPNGHLNVYRITGGNAETSDLSTARYGFLLLVISCYLRWRKKKTFNRLRRDVNVNNSIDESSVDVTSILRKFSSEDLKSATQDFQVRLGRGGFGSVYEGILGTGTKIAVKCLNNSGTVNQGKNEFLSEVKTIGKIHHFNLDMQQSEDMQNHKEDAVEMIKTVISCLQKNLRKRPSASMLVKVFEGFMNLEPVTDYKFLNSIHVETTVEEVCPGDSSSIMPSILSGPRS